MQLVWPDSPCLWNKAADVTDIAVQVVPLLPELRLVMAQAPHSVAMSAPQVGIGLRFFITAGRFLPSVVVNPEILERSTAIQRDREGCLTWPHRYRDVERAEWIRVRFFNVKGFEREDTFTGFAARIFQHEFDHLEGVCIFPHPDSPEAIEATPAPETSPAPQ